MYSGRGIVYNLLTTFLALWIMGCSAASTPTFTATRPPPTSTYTTTPTRTQTSISIPTPSVPYSLTPTIASYGTPTPINTFSRRLLNGSVVNILEFPLPPDENYKWIQPGLDTDIKQGWTDAFILLSDKEHIKVGLFYDGFITHDDLVDVIYIIYGAPGISLGKASSKNIIRVDIPSARQSYVLKLDKGIWFHAPVLP